MTDMNRKIFLPLSIAAGLGLGWGGFEAYYAPRVLPGVSAAGVPLGGLTLFESQTKLASAFKTQTPPTITVKAGDKSLAVSANELGWKPDAETTAKAAFEVGRNGGALENLGKRFSSINLPLSAQVDAAQFQARVKALTQPLEIVAKNAHISVTAAVLNETNFCPFRNSQSVVAVLQVGTARKARSSLYLPNTVLGTLVAASRFGSSQVPVETTSAWPPA